MQVKLSQAVKMFFGNSSLEMVFIEAVANALDAEATEINISINMKAANKPETLQVEISDNGLGFTDERYKKFSNLFDVDESSHKGLGRLVYLCYFDEVEVVSYYEKVKKRKFEFNEGFKANDFEASIVEERTSGTTFKMSGYALQKVAKNEYINVKYLKEKIQQEFYSRLFLLKEQKQEITINIITNIDNYKNQSILKNTDIPKFTTVELESAVNLIDKFYLHYSIEEVEYDKTSLVAAVSVDDRTIKVDIVADENIPKGFSMVFLLFSDYFNGKVDASRQNLTLSKNELKDIQTIFRKKVASLIEEAIPKIKTRNTETKNDLIRKFPHLSGYFDSNNIGYVAKNEILKKAQDEFFKSQKELLEATSLTDEQYEKSIEMSSRALTEYILFRQLTIDKLQKIDKSDEEATIHNLIVPQYRNFKKSNLTSDLYQNNAWILDDKYMTYENVLSDNQMKDLIDVITEGETSDDDNGKPDIALIFSSDFSEDKKVDVVIVELKKKGITLENTMVVETQLLSRARKLMKQCKNKIQRIWFYGIVEFNDDLENHLRGEYKELFSKGRLYYKPTNVFIQADPEIRLPIGIFIMNLDSVIEDANARNSTFLNLIKSKFIIDEISK